MAFLIAAPDRDCTELADLIRSLMPEIDLRVWPEIGDPSGITFALVWKPPAGLFGRLNRLEAISSLGAGVDGLVNHPEIPEGLPIGRLAGPRLATNMAAYLVAVVVRRWKRLNEFVADQRQRRWNQWAPEAPPIIGLLGTGAMGRATAKAFGALDFPMLGWNRSGQGPDGADMYADRSGLEQLAQQADFLINLLPLTDRTRDLLDAGLFRHMKPESTLINVGRGQHLVESDLLKALERGRPGFAILDVFRTEPLPAEHPFWSHPKILITPHCASITLTREAAELAVESYRRVLAGKPPLGQVDRRRGY